MKIPECIYSMTKTTTMKKSSVNKSDLDSMMKKPRQRKPKDQIVSNNLRQILDDREMTQQELSDLTGILPQHLSLIIKNKRKCISLPTALKISRALELSVEDIFTY